MGHTAFLSPMGHGSYRALYGNVWTMTHGEKVAEGALEWRAHGTQIRRIKADTEKNRQEVLSTTNQIEEAILKNNRIFTKKWESTHARIDC